MNLRSSGSKNNIASQSQNIPKISQQFRDEEAKHSEQEESSSNSASTEYSEDDSDEDSQGFDYDEDLLTNLEDLELEWTETLEFIKSNKIMSFRSKNPLKNDLSTLVEPENFFGLIITDEFLLQICKWTNENASAQRNRKRRESHEKKWEPITLIKLKAFLALLFLMPLVGKPNLKDYWSNKALTSTPGLKNILTRDEFLKIKRNIRFYDTQRHNKQDALYRVRPLMNEILSNTNENYNPPKELTLDETMISFKGRCKFRVYMPLKPVRYGFKAFTVTPSDEPIVLNLSVYDGTNHDLIHLVGSMLKPFESKGHIVYMDRYYSSPKVFKYLEEKGIGACGTCLLNRLQLTEEIKENIDSLQKNQFLYYESENLLLSVWKDKKPVTVLSTVHKVKQVRVIRRKRKQDTERVKKHTEAINIPMAIAEYNLKARGVDIFDQYASYQAFSHRSVKWYFRIIVFLLETACINSWVLYKNQQLSLKAEKVFDYAKYKRMLGKSFAHKQISKQIPLTPIKTLKRPPINDFTQLWGQCHLGKVTKKKLCFSCKNHKTRYICEECDIALCLIPCYDFHRSQENMHKVLVVGRN